MKLLTLGFLSLAPLTASIPVELQNKSPALEYQIVKGRMPIWDEILERRDDDYNWEYCCQYVTPNNKMPLVSEARTLANYLIGLGQADCVIEKAYNNYDPNTRVLAVTGISKAQFYFTPEAGDVMKVTMYCNKLGEWFNALINAFQKD